MQEKEVCETAGNSFLMIEYQKAQNSAEHHTNLGWTITSITCAGSLVLLGLVLNNITDPNITIILIVLAALGVVMSITMNLIDLKLARVAKQKYKRCKCLEDIFHGGQHRGQHQEHNSPGKPIRWLVNIITLSLATTWGSVIIFIILYNSQK